MVVKFYIENGSNFCFDSAESYRQGYFVANSLNSVLKMGVFHCIL